MNNKMTSKTDRDNRSLAIALLKGTLVWAPAYSVGSSALAYWLTPVLSDHTLSFWSILPNAAVLFLPWGVIGGTAKWMLHKYSGIAGNKAGKTRRKRNRRFTPKGGARLRPKHS